MNKLSLSIAVALTTATATIPSAWAANDTYSGFPVTLKGYSGDKTTSVSYGGQMARHVLHNSLKSLSKKGDGKNTDDVKAEMLAYFEGKDEGRASISPKSKDGFAVKQTQVDELSKGKNLAGKTYKGAVNGWPGGMTGGEVLAFMIDKAAATPGGYDPVNGYDYVQLISKTAMGAVFYNQAVDNYLDEKLAADNKPNDKPYKDGAYYTGKEHSWDEGFGYFGAPAHALTLDPSTVYAIAKQKPEAFKAADANGDGAVDLGTEMTYAHAYYAAGSDKKGKSAYLKTIMQAFIDGRQLITDAKGEALSDDQRKQLMGYADTIKTNWEKVIAEATYKYAGSVYEDLKKIETVIETNGEIRDVMRDYAKHWGELKGFALALQMGGKDLGETAVKLNRLIGFSPVLLGDTQVTGIDSDGNYVQEKSESMTEYMAHMIKVQLLLDEAFGLQAKANQIGDDLAALSEKIKSKDSGEND
jgi:hypothetical protein